MLADEKITITNISKSKKHLTKVDFDCEEGFLLDDDIVYENTLRVGLVLTYDELYELKSQSDFKRAKEKALWLLEYRDYSSRELHKKLLKDYDETTADMVINRLQDLSLIDDLSFARRYANDLINLKQLSGKRLEYELLKKGLDRNIIEEVLQDMPDNVLENIEDIFLKGLRFRNNDEKAIRRTVNKLRRMGYKFDDIRTVAERLEIKLFY